MRGYRCKFVRMRVIYYQSRRRRESIRDFDESQQLELRCSFTQQSSVIDDGPVSVVQYTCLFIICELTRQRRYFVYVA